MKNEKINIEINDKDLQMHTINILIKFKGIIFAF
jgi:hypothetical protein